MNNTAIEEICSECVGLDLQDFAEQVGQECEFCGTNIMDYPGQCDE